MYTRCPACSTVFELAAEDLARAGGVVRCGSCHKVFNALSLLFPDWPGAATQPAATGGMPPVLPAPAQGSLNLPDPDLDETDFDADDDRGPVLAFDEPEEPEATATGWRRWLWPGVAGAMFGILLLHWLLLGADNRQAVLATAGLAGGETILADPAEALQVVSRDMHDHPGLDDAVIISATLLNRADAPVPYPVLEVRLFDGSQQVIGQRRLEPADYLAGDTDISAGLDAGVALPVLLEMIVPGARPQGFEFRFY